MSESTVSARANRRVFKRSCHGTLMSIYVIVSEAEKDQERSAMAGREWTGSAQGVSGEVLAHVQKGSLEERRAKDDMT